MPAFLPIMGAWALGALMGALARQPEINRLKKQIKILQCEIVRLKKCIIEQHRQIKVLKSKFTALKAWQFIEKAQKGAEIKGNMLQAYALHDYIVIAKQAIVGDDISEEQQAFVNLYDKLINRPQSFTRVEFKLMESILCKWHAYEMKELIYPNMKFAIQEMAIEVG
jgi:hypothetical protein